jgi:hypothetical protein
MNISSEFMDKQELSTYNKNIFLRGQIGILGAIFTQS